jgi:hypothetical protein
VTSDPYAGPGADPYGARAMQTAVDRLVDAMAEKLKANVMGIPGPDPAVVELRVEEKDANGIDITATITVPLGTSRDGMGHLVAAATGILRDIAPLRLDLRPVEVGEKKADEQAGASA